MTTKREFSVMWARHYVDEARHYVNEARRLLELADINPAPGSDVYLNIAMILLVKAVSVIEPHIEKDATK